MPSELAASISALVITYNEAPNIDRTLSRLGWVRRILVVDSGSDDGTQQIVAGHDRTELAVRPFDNFANQWNFGLTHSALDTEWLLALDADYIVSDELVAEIRALRPPDDVAGYRAHFKYAIFGRPIRAGVYPPVVVLFRRRLARFVQDGHAQRVVVEGRIAELSGAIHHDDRKPLSRWLDSQKGYARDEAALLEQSDAMDLGWRDRIRTLIGLAPIFMFVYVYFVRGAVLDGRYGLYYALQRAYAELLLSLELLDRRLRRASVD